MAILTTLKSVLTLDNSDYKRKLDDSKSATDKFGAGIKKLGGVIAAAFTVQQIVRFGAEMARLYKTSDNVGRAFTRLGSPGLLGDLRRATGGMTSDLQLMQNAVQAVNLGLSEADLATYFKFATIRAAETGESVDYLVNSIVTGIGRKSPLILDNLGISITRINEEMEKTGDFTLAAAKIIREELSKSPTTVEQVSSGVDQLTVAWANFSLAVSQSGIGYAFDELARKAASFLNVWSGKGESSADDPFLLQTTNFEKLTKQQLIDALALAHKKFTETMGSPYWGTRIAAISRAMADLELKTKKVNKELEKTPPTLGTIGGPTISTINPAGEGFGTNIINLPLLDKGIQMLSDYNKEMQDATSQYYQLAGAAELYSGKLPDITKNMEDVASQMVRMNEVMADITSAAIGSFADAILNAIETGDVLGAFSGFLKDLGSLMVKYGASLVAFGVAQKVLATSPDPYSKIAAGAVLIAAGVAMSGLSKAISRGSASGSFSGGGYGAFSGGSYGGGAGYTENREIVMVARGKDLVAVIGKQNYEDYIGG